MASFVHTSWVNLYTNGPTALSGSNTLWQSLTAIYHTLTGYWNSSDADNSQYITHSLVTTGVDIWTRYDDGGGSLTAQSALALTSGSHWVCSATPLGFVTTIITGLSNDVISVRFNLEDESSINLGYLSIDEQGPYNLASGSPVEINGTGSLNRVSGAMGRRNTWWNLISHYTSDSVPGASGASAEGLQNHVFNSDNISGQNGWMTRFAGPYVGLKSAMFLYDAAQWCSAGWYTTTGGLTYPCAAPTSSTVPISSYSAAPINDIRYIQAYQNPAEYMYGWATAEANLTGSSAYFSSGGAQYVATEFIDVLRAGWEIAATSSWDTYVGNNWNDLTPANDDDKLIFTGPDSQADILQFREVHTAAGLRLQWDREHVNVPLSSISAMSATIWDYYTKVIFKYLSYNYDTYKYVREFLV